MERFEERKRRAHKVFALLGRLFPHANIALQYSNIWELLVAVILSAQCTDKKVNEITPALFKRYPTMEDYVRANVREFERYIRSAGFYHAKTKNILATARIVKEKFHGKVPRTMKEILQLPGVARKTANVVLGNAYHVVEGIAVDTHVKRLSQKLGLTDYSDPNKIEQDLMKLLPRKDWFSFTYRIIEYGRQICTARKHDCLSHPLTKLYPKAATSWPSR